MAAYNGNNVYIDIDGTQIDSDWKSVTLTPSVATVETTRGSSTANIQRAVGLMDHSISIQLGYDTSDASTVMGLFSLGSSVTITYGPEGNSSGKPKHVQDFIITTAS